jgi:hypothetical protein
MNTLIRSIIYLCVGLILVMLFDITDARLGWHIDMAWLLLVAAAFGLPVELAPLGGILFGLTRDGLSGDVSLIYTVSYGGFGLIVLLIRRGFFLRGFFPSWIIAVVGAEVLWLFMGFFSQAMLLLGVATRTPGWLSPFLLSTLIIYPVVYLAAMQLLRNPAEPQRAYPRYLSPDSLKL